MQCVNSTLRENTLCVHRIVTEQTAENLGSFTDVIYVPYCDQRCKFCFNKDLAEGNVDIDRVDFRTILLTLSPISDIVAFTGGEPLLQNPQLLNCIKFIQDGSVNLREFHVFTHVPDELFASRILNEIPLATLRIDIKWNQSSINTAKSLVDKFPGRIKLSMVPWEGGFDWYSKAVLSLGKERIELRNTEEKREWQKKIN